MENNSTVLALVGERAAELALAQAEPGTELCRETGVPYFPKLGARQNAVNLRMVMKPEQAELFWELLKVGGVRKAGWNLPFRQDQRADNIGQHTGAPAENKQRKGQANDCGICVQVFCNAAADACDLSVLRALMNTAGCSAFTVFVADDHLIDKITDRQAGRY